MKFTTLLYIFSCSFLLEVSCGGRRFRFRRQGSPSSLLSQMQKIRSESQDIVDKRGVDLAVRSIFNKTVIIVTQIENILKRNPELQFIGLSRIKGANLVVKRVQELQETAKQRIARANLNQDITPALTALRQIQRIEEVLVWEPPEDTRPHKKLLPLSCGLSQSLKDRIRGGVYSEQGALPWMVQLRYPSVGRSELPFCGGALITQNVVLTAAHCLYEDRVRLRRTNEFTVRLGQYDVRDSSGRDFFVEKILVHPRYNPQRKPNDIALLYISRPITKFDDKIRPICLPDSTALRQNDFNGRPVLVAGWGIVDPDKRTRSERLLELKLEVVSNAVCNHNFSSFNEQIDGTMICAGDPEKGQKDSCQGDSGGPLMLQNGAKYYIIGVVSFGQLFCGNEPIPGIYARVTTFMDWVLSNL